MTTAEAATWESVRKAILENPHGYAQDKYKNLICPWCGVGTNPVYANVPKLTCWSCSMDMRPSYHDAVMKQWSVGDCEHGGGI